MSNIKINDVIEGQITGITKYGVFVSLEDNYVGMIHISEVSNKFVSDLEKMYKIGDLIKVKVIDIDEDKLQVKLSIKKLKPNKLKRKTIEEIGDGFTPLKENLDNWVQNKIKDYDNLKKK